MKTYTARDFYLTGFLVASGTKLLEYTRVNGSTDFHFEHTDQLDSLVNDYYWMKATVNPVTYGQALKHLKGLIHSNININSQVNNYVSQRTGTLA
jgi:hypothetical protein